MKSNLIIEVSRIKEIMGLISEQEESNLTPNSWKEYDGGKPAALFEEKGTSASKKYMDSQLEGDTITGWKNGSQYRITYQGMISQLGEEKAKRVWDSYRPKSENREGWYDSPIIDGYLYSWTKYELGYGLKVEKNPDFNPAVRKIVNADYPSHRNARGDERKWNITIPALTSEMKVGFMKYIAEFVESNYGGNYDKANRKIQKILIKKGKFTATEEGGEEQPQINALYSDYKVSGVDGIPFVNNEWGVSENIQSHIQQTKAAIEQVLSTNPGVTAKISTKAVVKGEEKNVPYSISTSASRYRNTGNAKNMSFIELSQKRAEEIHKYVISELGGLVKFPNPVLDIKGENGDGSSGPNPPTPNQFFNKEGKLISTGNDGRDDFGKPLTNPKDYDKYKYCRVVFVISFTSDGSSTSPTPPSGGRLGDWSIKIDDEKERKPIKWPKLNISWNLPTGGGGGGGHLPCAAYN